MSLQVTYRLTVGESSNEPKALILLTVALATVEGSQRSNNRLKTMVFLN